MNSLQERLERELDVTSEPRDLISLFVWAALSFVSIAVTMGGLLIPCLVIGMALLVASKSSALKRVGCGLVMGPLLIGFMLLAYLLLKNL